MTFFVFVSPPACQSFFAKKYFADSKSKCKTRLDNLQHLLARREGLPR